MSNTVFDRPDLSAFTRLDGLGLEVTGQRIEIVAMDGFTGFTSAAAEELPGARAVMDPFHVVRLAGDAHDECHRRTEQELHHRRGRATVSLYKARRMLHTRLCLLTLRQQHRMLDLFASDCHVAL